MSSSFLRKGLFLFFVFMFFLGASSAYSASRLKFSCSAQIADAFGRDVAKLLKAKTGFELVIKVVSSRTALNRLENDFSDIAAITIPLSYNKLESGYVAIPFCRDPIVIIAGKDTVINNISSAHIRDVFSGAVSNWKSLGDKDVGITRIVPCSETGAYMNFHRLFMGMEEIKYDFMTYLSIISIQGVKQIKGSISFISHGAASKAQGIKILKIDNISPEKKGYKYFQTFTFVTKGAPSGPAKELIDIALSEQGQAVMKAKGMIPVLP